MFSVKVSHNGSRRKKLKKYPAATAILFSLINILQIPSNWVKKGGVKKSCDPLKWVKHGEEEEMREKQKSVSAMSISACECHHWHTQTASTNFQSQEKPVRIICV